MACLAQYCVFLFCVISIYASEKKDHVLQARQALEYVYRIENSDDCNVGTEKTLHLEFNHSAWTAYTDPAVRTANQLSKFLMMSGDNLDSLSDEVLFSFVRNNVHGGTLIFGSAIAVEPGVYNRYDSFCPYAYKKNNSVYAHDIAVNYDYLSESTEWYNAVKIRNWGNASIEVDSVMYRLNNSLLPITREIQPLAKLGDGHWTLPYFDCGGGDIWMVTYSSPIFGLDIHTNAPVFKGVATIDIELTNIDINQCDPEGENTGALGAFGGTHICSPSTKCVHIAGQGFRRGAYQCVCIDGYYFPDTSSITKAFSGFEIEELYDNNDTTTGSKFQCLLCAPGCDTCVDSSPCLYSVNMAVRLVVLCLAILQMFVVIFLSAATHIYRVEMAIKTGSPIFLQIMCAGSVVMIIQMFILFPEHSDILCSIAPWPKHIGFALLYGALILKTWRISLIFRVGKVKRVRLPDQTLAQRLVPILGVTIVYLGAWTAANPPRVETFRTSSDLNFFFCSSSWWSYASHGAEALMLLFGVYLCFTVRKAPAHFNESKHITWSTYNAIILGTFLTIVSHFIAHSSGPDVLYILQFLEVQVLCTITLCLIFGPKFWAVKRKTELHESTSGQIHTITGRLKRVPTVTGMHAATREASVQTDFSSIIIEERSFLSVPKTIAGNKVAPSDNQMSGTLC